MPAVIGRLSIILFATAAFGQRTVNDGVYAEAQARRGEAVYGANCAGCHGEALQGKSDSPLRGAVFMDRWREDSLDVVFRHMRTLMPARAPGSLAESAYVDILSFVLETNGFPPGPQELTIAALPSIQLVGKNGPQPLPTNATVRVTGCLTPGANDTWTLSKAGSPGRTRNGDEITPDEAEAAKASPLGAASFRLQNLDDFRPGFTPDAWKDHKVLAKGVLNHLSSGDRIHVLALTSLASDCTK